MCRLKEEIEKKGPEQARKKGLHTTAADRCTRVCSQLIEKDNNHQPQ